MQATTVSEELEQVKWAKLQATLTPIDRSVDNDRQDGRYTDFTVVCDDGTILRLHKLIVCTQVKAIELGLKECFKEGQNSEYHLPEKQSSAVTAFFDLVYGKPQPCPLEWPTLKTDPNTLLLMAQVYALADELQADKVLAYSLEWFKLVIPFTLHLSSFHESMIYIYENANQKDSFFEHLIQICAARVVYQIYPTTPLTLLFEELPKYRTQMRKAVLKLSGCDLGKLLIYKKFDAVLEVNGVSDFVWQECSNYRKPTVTQIWEIEAFRRAVTEHDMVDEVVAALIEEGVQRTLPSRLQQEIEQALPQRVAAAVDLLTSSDNVKTIASRPLKICTDCRTLLPKVFSTHPCPFCARFGSITVIVRFANYDNDRSIWKTTDFPPSV